MVKRNLTRKRNRGLRNRGLRNKSLKNQKGGGQITDWFRKKFSFSLPFFRKSDKLPVDTVKSIPTDAMKMASNMADKANAMATSVKKNVEDKIDNANAFKNCIVECKNKYPGEKNSPAEEPAKASDERAAEALAEAPEEAVMKSQIKTSAAMLDYGKIGGKKSRRKVGFGKC